MKHAFLLVSLLAVCTVGCAFDWYPQRVEGAYQRQMRMVRPMPAAHEEVLAPAEPGEEGVAAGPVGPIGPITPLPEG